MWSTSVLSLVLAAAPPHEPAASNSITLSQAEISCSISERFPGAIVLSEADFASTVKDRSFRYRDIGSGIVIHSPGEFFGEDGRYSFGHRAISRGTYSFNHGIVSIDGTSGSFLGLGKERIFFRHQGRVFTTSAVEGGAVYELVRSP